MKINIASIILLAILFSSTVLGFGFVKMTQSHPTQEFNRVESQGVTQSQPQITEENTIDPSEIRGLI